MKRFKIFCLMSAICAACTLFFLTWVSSDITRELDAGLSSLDDYED